jgi:hypothetical protein
LGASAIITIGVVILLAPEADTTGMTTDLAILPFQSSSGESPALGEEIARLAAMHIEGGLPAGRISVTPIAQAFRWWSVSGDTATLALAGAGPALRARRVVTGSVHRVGDSLDVRVRLLDPDGSSRESPVIRGVMASPYDLGYAVGLAIIRLDRPAAATAYQGAPALLGRASEAIRAFIAGEAAFQREMWAAAAAEYRRAIAADSTLAMAWWRLFNVQRWRRIPPDFDLARIVAAYPDAFFPSDMELIEATLAPAGAERLRRFRDAGRRAPLDAYAHLLYANELFHRGPLSGFTRDSAVSVYRTALAADSMLAPAYGGLAWAAIAIGDGPTARDALDRYRRITSPQTDDDFCLGCFLELAQRPAASTSSRPGPCAGHHPWDSPQCNSIWPTYWYTCLTKPHHSGRRPWSHRPWPCSVSPDPKRRSFAFARPRPCARTPPSCSRQHNGP